MPLLPHETNIMFIEIKVKFVHTFSHPLLEIVRKYGQIQEQGVKCLAMQL